MTYCSKCGCPLSRQWIAHEERVRNVCSSCGTTHYQNPRVIVIGLVHWRDRILMCRRAHDPARGEWGPPSGFLECGETLEEAAAREVREETGVAVDPGELELYTVIDMPAIEQVAIAFRIELSGRPVTRPGHECLAIEFFSEDELPEALAWRESMGGMLQRFFGEIRSGHFSIQVVNLGSGPGIGSKSRKYELMS